MPRSDYRDRQVRAKTREVVGYHYDEEKPGKPLYLLIPGGLIALASLALIVYLAYATWLEGSLEQGTGLLLILLLAPFYVGGVFLFSYGYELYNVPRALRLTAIIVFITLAAVVILAVLFVVLAALSGKSRSSSKSSSSSSRASFGSSGGGGGGGGWVGGLGPIFINTGGPTRTVTHEVIREVPGEPPPPESIVCEYCGRSYVPAETKYACPNCGAPAPKDVAEGEEGARNDA
jgi:hypothetical protein